MMFLMNSDMVPIMDKNNNWKSTLMSRTGLIKNAIEILSETSMRIVLVTDSDLRLFGTVTDGDIRRALLRGLSLESPISEVVNRKPVVVPENISREAVLKIMSANKILQIPVVDDELKLKGLHSWEDLSIPANRDNVVVIMAGGKGTRLLPKTEKTPKPMLLINGKPVLEHIINHTKAEGFTKFVLAIHHLGDVVESYFGNGDSLGVEISYIREESPLGTAGALSLIDPIPSDPIIVTNGDVLTGIRYGEMLDFHIQNDAEATMAVQIHEVHIPYGVIRASGLYVTSYEEKPTQKFLINAGVYVIDPNCLPHLPEKTAVDMPSFLESLTAKGFSTLAYMIHERWLDIGNHEEFAKATDYVTGE